MKEWNPTTEPIGHNLINLISNRCFAVFVFSVLIFIVISITCQSPDHRSRTRAGNAGAKVSPPIRDEDINDTIPSLGSEMDFRKRKVLVLFLWW